MKIKAMPAALGLTLLLASCGGNTTPPAPTESDPALTTIRGNVAAGSGAGKVSLPSASGSVLAEAPVDASGNFTLTLPAADKFAAELRTADSVFSSIGCTGKLNSSVADAKGYAVSGLKAQRTDVNDRILAANVVIQLLPPKGKLTARTWLYTDKATTLTGTLDCSKLVNNAVTLNMDTNVQTRAGWNLVAIYAEGTTSFRALANTVGDEPTEWRTEQQLREAVRLPSF